MSTAKFDTWMNPDGTTNYKCRAWVNFDGRSASLGIRASGNVSSVTRTTNAEYIVNIITAMPDTNYAVCPGHDGFGTATNAVASIDTQTTTSFRYRFNQSNGGRPGDREFVFAAVFR